MSTVHERPEFITRIFKERPHWGARVKAEVIRQTEKDKHGNCLCFFCKKGIWPDDKLEIHHIEPWGDIKAVAKMDPELWILDEKAVEEAAARLFNDLTNVAPVHEECHRKYEKDISKEKYEIQKFAALTR